ncbi:MAG: hypothetical protein KC432_14455 [Thermomicrobiales bacterium]|nr:hypothetical protein [Thermomicrobiales bacterium]
MRTAGLAVHQVLPANSATLACSDNDLAAWVIALTLGLIAETLAACLRSFITPVR